MKSMMVYIPLDHYNYLKDELVNLEYLINNQDEIDFRYHMIFILSLILWHQHAYVNVINEFYGLNEYYRLIKNELADVIELQYKTHRSSGFIVKD